jgi:hypothetical protein
MVPLRLPHIVITLTRQTGYVKPQHQDQDGAQRSVRFVIAIKKMEITAQNNGRNNPENHAYHRTGSDPIPVPLFKVRGIVIVVDDRESQNYECQRECPLQNLTKGYCKII